MLLPHLLINDYISYVYVDEFFVKCKREIHQEYLNCIVPETKRSQSSGLKPVNIEQKERSPLHLPKVLFGARRVYLTFNKRINGKRQTK